jgi:hypothetical protein
VGYPQVSIHVADTRRLDQYFEQRATLRVDALAPAAMPVKLAAKLYFATDSQYFAIKLI